MVDPKDCQRRYDRVKKLLDDICTRITNTEVFFLNNEAGDDRIGRLSALWDLKNRYTMEKVELEKEFRKILKGIDD